MSTTYLLGSVQFKMVDITNHPYPTQNDYFTNIVLKFALVTVFRSVSPYFNLVCFCVYKKDKKSTYFYEIK